MALGSTRYVFRFTSLRLTSLSALLELSILTGVSPAQDRGVASKTVSLVESAWRDLDSADAVIRKAARLKIEAGPFESWRSRALEEVRPWASIEALRALCEACPVGEGAALRPHLCEGITTLRIEQMSAAQMLAAIRLTRLVCTRFGAPAEDERRQMLDLWSHILAPKAPEKSTTPQDDPDGALALAKRVSNEMRDLVLMLSR